MFDAFYYGDMIIRLTEREAELLAGLLNDEAMRRIEVLEDWKDVAAIIAKLVDAATDV